MSDLARLPSRAFRHPAAEAQEAPVGAVGETRLRRSPPGRGMRVEARGLAVAVRYRHVAADEIRRVETEMARAMGEHLLTMLADGVTAENAA